MGQAEQNALGDARKDLQKVKLQEAQLAEEDAKLLEEVNERKAELKEAITERDEADAAHRAAESRAAESVAECKIYADEISEKQKYNAQLVSELQAAEQELRDWMDSKEQAAALTAQAHRLLGH